MASEGVPPSRSEGGDGSAAHCRTQKKMNTVHKYIMFKNKVGQGTGSAAGARYPTFFFFSFPFSLLSFDCASRLLSTVGSHVCAKTL